MAGHVVLTFGAVTIPVEIEATSSQATVRVRDTALTLTLEAAAAGAFAVTCNGRRMLAHYATDGTTHYLHIDGETYTFHRGTVEEERRRTAAGHDDLRAPMPGVVTQVFVQAGQTVAPGDPLYVVEAMKIETVVRASSACRVGRVRLTPGTQVEGGAVVIEVETLE